MNAIAFTDTGFGVGWVACRAMLRLSERVYLQMIGHAYDGLPYEACGLLVGRSDKASRFAACANAAASSRVYAVDPLEYARVEDDADRRGLTVLGVMHSHTHTEAYPSPTDVDQAFDPNWHYVIVSLRLPEPVLRSFHIDDGTITEEPVAVERG